MAIAMPIMFEGTRYSSLAKASGFYERMANQNNKYKCRPERAKYSSPAKASRFCERLAGSRYHTNLKP